MAHILIADDDPGIRRLLRLMLREDGHEVREAADGAEALRACREEEFDLLLCDLVMPNKEGLETIREARRSFSGLRIVAMSGGCAGFRSWADLLRVARLIGADDALAKPFSRQELLDALGATAGEGAAAGS